MNKNKNKRQLHQNYEENTPFWYHANWHVLCNSFENYTFAWWRNVVDAAAAAAATTTGAVMSEMHTWLRWKKYLL